MSLRRLAVLGAGGHARVVADAALCGGEWDEVLHYADETPSGRGPVLAGSVDEFFAGRPRVRATVVGIGDARVRARLQRRLHDGGHAVATVRHPGACIASNVVIGAGSVVLAGAVVNVCASIGRGAILNTASSVDHDCRVHDFVHLCPGARLAGGVTVGEASWIGIGASIIQGVTIGSGVTVGAGAAVIRDLPSGVVAVGVPAVIKPARSADDPDRP